jgi:hypothetical protein
MGFAFAIFPAVKMKAYWRKNTFWRPLQNECKLLYNFVLK